MQSRDIDRSQLDATSTDFGIAAAAVRPGKRQRSDTDTLDGVHEMPKAVQEILRMMRATAVVTHSPNPLAAPFRDLESDIIFRQQSGDFYQTHLIPGAGFYIIIRMDKKLCPPTQSMSTLGL
jgi:hypothetical protein